MAKDELLIKSKCVRCGKQSKNGGKGSRCSSCLKKLARRRATPGSKERSWKHADQAIRREQGRSGTTTGGHSSGHGNRQAIQRKMRSAEKKTGSKLSLDRKNNSRGYESKNTRAVPERLNRGRHSVDKKKLSSWKKRLNKCGITNQELYTFLLAKATINNDSNAVELLKSLGPNGLVDILSDST